ncbi:MAG: hypothetical protein HY22_06765 [[Candidatus Thermochlorobacteriaceae] bacterium GBChlB]|nr:MAG: hypothetical protein HY22_06765 [[Candidatus Thermochlorobacteriaceae] bacterium GBChlB]
MITLDTAIPQIATMLNAKLTPGEGVYTIDVPFAMPNGRMRYQKSLHGLTARKMRPNVFM